MNDKGHESTETALVAHTLEEGERLIARHGAHRLLIGGGLIRALTKPVVIAWPGVTISEAARRLGRTYDTMMEWVLRGAMRIERVRAPKHPKGDKPMVWSPRPIDPNNFHGRQPHAVWGSLWMQLWEKLPEDYELAVRREPRVRAIRGGVQFKGWEFVCPGRRDAYGAWRACGRRCTYLYGPQSVWTLARAIGEVEEIEMPRERGLAGGWVPGASDMIAERWDRSFACKECWGVQSACMANSRG